MKHLNIDRWFYKQPNGYLRMKRVSTPAEAQFPRRLRRIYQRAEGNPVALVKQLQQDSPINLTQAWDTVKRMFNEVLK